MAFGDAADKTEPPSPRKLSEARKLGQIAKSTQIGSWFSLLAATFLLPAAFGNAERRISGLTNLAGAAMAHPSLPRAIGLFQLALTDVVLITLPIGAIVAASSLFATFLQVRVVFATGAMKPDFGRFNPFKGIKRLFSLKVGWQLAQQVVQFAVVAGVAVFVMRQIMPTLLGNRPVSLGIVVGYMATEILLFVRYVAIACLAFGVVDYLYQKRQIMKSLKMTKAEAKEEFRRHQAPPEARKEIRRRQIRLARARMMAKVKTADLVVTNPTHIAVAVKYEPKRRCAPRVVAKGEDWLAFRIREEAQRHGVPVVEDPPLARALHAACELDEEIPLELYVAVARLLAFVLTMPDALRRGRSVHRRSASAMVA